MMSYYLNLSQKEKDFLAKHSYTQDKFTFNPLVTLIPSMKGVDFNNSV